jgi:hypothetical protein
MFLKTPIEMKRERYQCQNKTTIKIQSQIQRHFTPTKLKIKLKNVIDKVS